MLTWVDKVENASRTKQRKEQDKWKPFVSLKRPQASSDTIGSSGTLLFQNPCCRKGHGK